MGDFLASVEKRAYVMAKLATQNPDNALDIVQDTMFQMVKNYGEKPQEDWQPLFFRILSNKITDYHRKPGILAKMTQWFGLQSDRETQSEEAVSFLVCERQRPDQELQNEQLGTLLLQKLKRLPVRQQQAITLRMWQGLSIEETAAVMNVSAGSVKTHLHRAIQVMQAQLSEYKGT